MPGEDAGETVSGEPVPAILEMTEDAPDETLFADLDLENDDLDELDNLDIADDEIDGGFAGDESADTDDDFIEGFANVDEDIDGESERIKEGVPAEVGFEQEPAAMDDIIEGLSEGAEVELVEVPADEITADDNVVEQPVVAGARPPDVASFETAERLKRIAGEAHGFDSLKNGESALLKRDYAMAIALFEEALKFLPDRPDLTQARNRTKKGLAGAYYLRALAFERMGEFDKAKAAALSSVKYGYMKAGSAVNRIQKKIEGGPPPIEVTDIKRWNQEKYIENRKEAEKWMRYGRQAYLTEEYEEAIRAFESVLKRDPEHKEAIRLMRSAAQKRYDRSSMELEATRTRMMATVRDTWNPRDYGLHENPLEEKGPDDTEIQHTDTKKAAIIKKMENIRIPEIDFRQANIRDVIDFLHDQSVENDPDAGPSGGKGVNFILKLPEDTAVGGGGGGDMGEADPFGADPFGGGDAGFDDLGGGAGSGEILVTFSVLDVSLLDALDYAVDIANMKYRIKGNAVIIVPMGSADSAIEHRMYDVLPTVVERIEGLLESVVAPARGGGGGGDFIGMGDAGIETERTDWKKFFAEMGVEWPEKSQIKYVAGIGKIIVANTAENLAVFEKVLSVLNVVPYQIEIEARFVEVAQTDVDSLGFEWLLTDNWEIAQRRSDSGQPLSSRQRIQMNANSTGGGSTRGMRYLTSDSTSGLNDDIFSLSSVLTNPEVSMILHALQQRGHTDVLSAPKIVAQSGAEATIKVVTEYIYPTEFETEGISGSSGSDSGNGGTVGAVVTPESFETREVGVILNVVPEVSPEGQMINLTLAPEVVSEPTWKNYGSSYQSDVNQDGVLETQMLNMEQPFFHTRSLTTSMLIYNGATVVMGGMITETRVDVDDKVPLLGDIPFLGHLFRSKYEKSEKRNLLIFVTARLVDPAGRALDAKRFGISDSIATRLVAEDETAE